MFSRGSLNGIELNGGFASELNGGPVVEEGAGDAPIVVLGAIVPFRWEGAGDALISLILSLIGSRRLGKPAGHRTMVVPPEYRRSYVAPENRVMIVVRRRDEDAVDPISRSTP